MCNACTVLNHSLRLANAPLQRRARASKAQPSERHGLAVREHQGGHPAGRGSGRASRLRRDDGGGGRVGAACRGGSPAA
eukprot:3871502-Prymnesium_polylepis.1